jgi:hypothetical protein
MTAMAIAAGMALPLLLVSIAALAQTGAVAAGPPSSGAIFPLSEVRQGMMATAWTVFKGSKPEPMEVEILGVLYGARGPGHDMILVQLHGAKPEYTGVVAGMSGSPVYIGDKLLGSLSYRIGQFSKDPIAGVTPIEQMLEVRDLAEEQGLGTKEQGLGTKEQGLGTREQGLGTKEQGLGTKEQGLGTREQGTENRDRGLGTRDPGLGTRGDGAASGANSADGMNFQAMETPLVMSGFRPEAIRLWQERMAGTGLEMIAAGGMSSRSASGSGATTGGKQNTEISAAALATVVPGSAVSAQLVRGDLEISATCTVTYIDPKQLLACGHPLLQAGHVSLPMTTTDVVATLASPLNAFKIVNTGDTIGTFTEDRDSAIRGMLGQKARMIPVHVTVDGALHGNGGHGNSGDRTLNFEVLDLPSLTAQAVLVGLYESLLETNESTAETSYHLTGSIDLEGYPASPLDLWASSGGNAAAPLQLALMTGLRFQQIYSNSGRLGTVRGIDLHVEAFPREMEVELETAKVISSDIVHAGDTVTVEATIRPWQQPSRNVRIPVKLPARLGAGNLRLLISDAGTLDRTLDQPRMSAHSAELDTVLAQARRQHPADRIYVSLLVPETQAGLSGVTLQSLPLSMANALEPLRTAQDVNLNGESAEVEAEAPADGVFSGFQILNVRIESGGGLD